MFEKIFKKQEKVQEKIQKQQELNDKDCRELTDEELDQLTGGTTVAVLKVQAQETPGSQVMATLKETNRKRYVEITASHF